nr:hypothetical protein CFP56_76037 [Quercus suber]
MNRLIGPKCLKWPAYIEKACAGKSKRLLATEASLPTRKDKKEGDISAIFTSFSGKKAEPLPSRFLNLKRNLTSGFEQQIQQSWDDLVEVLKVRTEEIKFSDIQNNGISPKSIEAIRRTGVTVVRGVMPKDVTEALLNDVRRYFASHPVKGFPSNADEKIRPPGDKHFALSPHVDGGGVERWEDRAYNHVYRKIFQGKEAVLYSGRSRAGLGCLNMVRSKPSTAYWMLRPFFKPTRKDSLDGWKFSLDDDEGQVYLHGANPGTAQEHTPTHHPHLNLQETMIPYPRYVAQQRDAFLAGVPPPDFPGGVGESQFTDRAHVSDIQSEAGRIAMGLSPVAVVAHNGARAGLEREVNGIFNGH